MAGACFAHGALLAQFRGACGRGIKHVGTRFNAKQNRATLVFAWPCLHERLNEGFRFGVFVGEIERSVYFAR